MKIFNNNKAIESIFYKSRRNNKTISVQKANFKIENKIKGNNIKEKNNEEEKMVKMKIINIILAIVLKNTEIMILE